MRKLISTTEKLNPIGTAKAEKWKYLPGLEGQGTMTAELVVSPPDATAPLGILWWFLSSIESGEA
ncbi:hypothetical protein I5M27_01225 [Adhaeribacter sp. BT258]|uniref:Uncharacterized protein n=1 Tax=Adhaeribacter terrigena TaxID=2793070 RepID=A0ABS1BWS7_9BACT|nr:hypothetical protein [Adhaeribacter terrigena]MBK0401584.1 hypothetical protein [Adhaeribacter terrigena]